MGVSKRISTGDYEITTFPNTINPYGNVAITTNTVVITGNLKVIGTTTNVQAYDTTLSIFHLNSNLTIANTPAPGYSGIENNRGNQANVGLYWDEDGSNAGEWIANNGTDLGPILTSYNVKLDKSTDNPISVNDYVVISGNVPDVGGTGIFVNAGVESSEIVAVPAARKFAIIFGG